MCYQEELNAAFVADLPHDFEWEWLTDFADAACTLVSLQREREGEKGMFDLFNMSLGLFERALKGGVSGEDCALRKSCETRFRCVLRIFARVMWGKMRAKMRGKVFLGWQWRSY